MEAIFRKRGIVIQEQLDTWLTETTPEWNWKDKFKAGTYKCNCSNSHQLKTSDGEEASQS